MSTLNQTQDLTGGEIESQLKDLAHNRAAVLDEFTKAWLAAEVEDQNLDPLWLVKNCELVERRSPDGLEVSWFFRKREDS